MGVLGKRLVRVGCQSPGAQLGAFSGLAGSWLSWARMGQALRELPRKVGGVGMGAELSRNHVGVVPVPGNVGLFSDFVTPELIPWEAKILNRFSARWTEKSALEPRDSEFDLGSATYWLCDLGQIA